MEPIVYSPISVFESTGIALSSGETLPVFSFTDLLLVDNLPKRVYRLVLSVSGTLEVLAQVDFYFNHYWEAREFELKESIGNVYTNASCDQEQVALEMSTYDACFDVVNLTNSEQLVNVSVSKLT